MTSMDDAQPSGRGNLDRDRSGRPPWKLIGLLVVVVILATFFLQNGQRSEVQFLWLDVSWPLWTIIAISVGIGVILDRLATWQWRRARARRRAVD
jgi:uncharacterized integral membrane protein